MANTQSFPSAGSLSTSPTASSTLSAPRAKVLGLGKFTPSKCVTNHDLAKIMDTSDEWIQQRTGIKQRYYVDFDKEPMGASTLGARAGQAALLDAGLQPEDIDCIIYATLSPDKGFPGDGVLLQQQLNIPAGVPAYDVRNQCSGFLYGLQMANSFIQSGLYQRILLVGAEVHSTGLDFSNAGRDVAVLFGDGAAACVLGPTSDAQEGVLATTVHADGRFANDLQISYPSSACMPRISAEGLAANSPYPQMNGRMVFRHAVTKMPEAIKTVCAKAGVPLDEISLLIPHQANLRISEAVAGHFGWGAERMFNNISTYGNTTAASIPLAMWDAREQGVLKRGDLLCLASFGAGFTWGAALLYF